jgi:transcriptional regulator with XRE-family HTH domain
MQVHTVTMSNQFGTPTLARIGLGVLITRAREEAGMTIPEVASALGIDPETVRRWEKGQVAPKKLAIEALATVIHPTSEQFSRMTTLSLDSKKKGMFEGNNVPPELRVLYETEATARLIRSLELEYIPGLLQTIRYHRTAQAAQVPIEEGRAEVLRRLRTQRQEITFGRSPLPRMRFLIGIAALLYLDHYPDVRDEQIARLREVNEMPGVEIRVIRGLHAAMLGSFTILTPPSATGAQPFGYVEDNDGGRYVEGDVVSEYEAVFQMAWDRQSIELEEHLQ